MARNENENEKRIKQVIPWWDLKHRGTRSELLRRAFQGEDVGATYRPMSGGNAMRNVWADGKRIPLHECRGPRGGNGGDAA